MIWRTILPYLILITGLAIMALAFFQSAAEATPFRYTAIKKLEGLHERKHRRQIKRIVGVDPVRTPWCGAAVAYAVRKAGGVPVKGHLGAANWKRFGKAVKRSGARKGDIVVYRFKRGHHVAIFSHFTKAGRHVACGGNQSNRFKCSSYRNSSMKAVRR